MTRKCLLLFMFGLLGIASFFQSCAKCSSTDKGIIVKNLNSNGLIYPRDTAYTISGSGIYYFGNDSIDLDKYSIIYQYADGVGCDIDFQYKRTSKRNTSRPFTSARKGFVKNLGCFIQWQ